MNASDRAERGAIAWFTRHRVGPNLLMLVLILGGLFTALQIKQEVFPEFERDTVTVSVALPGASPEEVERGIILAIEEELRSVDGVKEISATANEGSGRVVAELQSGGDHDRIFQDIQQAVSRITTFPDDAERPRITLDSRRRGVLDLQLFGDVDEWALREAAEVARDRLLAEPGITQVELEGARDFEIHIEIPQERLRAYGLTLDSVASTIREAALDRGGGSIRTEAGEILLRVQERRDWAREFAQIPLIAGAGGALVRLGDVADVSEGFADSHRLASFNGKRAIGIAVYRVGDETPVSVSNAVRTALPDIVAALPPSIELTIEDDASEVYMQRLELLLKNGFFGLLLVLGILTLFLEFRLAFWVTAGIPTAFLGALLFLPVFDISINMMSLFAFIVALGIIVDDAIIVGENIYEYRQRGLSNLEAAIRGAKDLAVPVVFAIVTNIVAFLPLMFIPGTFGKIWSAIPLVTGVAFTFSLIEALFILPAHLGHNRGRPAGGMRVRLFAWQQAFSSWFQRMVETVYGPFLRMTMRWRYLTMSAMLALLIVTLALPMSGRMGFILMPTVESDFAQASATLPVGSPIEQAITVRDRLVDSVSAVIAANGGEALSTGIFSSVNENSVTVRAYLKPPGERPLSTGEVTRLWREQTGEIAGLEMLRFAADARGPGSGASVSVELRHRDIPTLERAATELADRLEEFANVNDVDDGHTPGKVQLDIRTTEEARSLGLSSAEIARQVRAAFHGVEAIKQQRGRNEITVRVRLPDHERRSEADIENLILRTPDGGEVPLFQVATVERGRAYTSISRRDGRRAVTVSANVYPQSETSRILDSLSREVLPQLSADHPGLSWSFEGRQAFMRDAIESFFHSVTLALLAIYALLAIPFRSYVQPAIVMTAIPFGVVGAIMGHLIMGYSLSVVSVMGIIALGGVVINAALVMIDYANDRRKRGSAAFEAIHEAGIRRFRPIMLTTLTTFGGLAPMIFETSRQARFLIPMALSLGYGILFASAIVLVLIPSLYMIIEDLKHLAAKITAALSGQPPAPVPSGAARRGTGEPERIAAE